MSWSASSSRAPSSTDLGIQPDPKDIQEVVQACSCREDEAVELLQRSKNDVDRAIRSYAIMKRYLGNNLRIRSPSHTPTKPSAANSPSLGPSFEVITGDESGLEDDTTGEATSQQKLQLPSPIQPQSRDLRRKGRETVNVSPAEDPFSASIDDKLSSFHLIETPPQEMDTPFTSRVDENPHTSSKTVVPGHVGLHQWDFVLPRISSTADLKLEINETSDHFNIHDLIAAIQNGAALQVVERYLGRFEKESIRRKINEDIEEFPAIFYVVETNNEPLLRLWIQHGGNPEALHYSSQIPLLAFAIINSETIQTDTTLITTTLLSLGASPKVIPSEFYIPYLRDIPEIEQGDHKAPEHSDLPTFDTEWCVGSARAKLARTVTLSQRYFLEKAHKTKKPSQRHVALAERRNAEPLLCIPYFLIGQTIASNLLLQKLLSHLLSPGKRPLVLVFAGPSGHGKTELARKLGHLLSLELEVVDCTIFNREIELFGPREPYVGSEKGSPLNNFLARNADQRCIVFLDEFEKTTSDIHKSLLLPFDNGEYQDRRDKSTINCSKTIWILATNAHDTIIQDFSSTHQEVFFGENESDKFRLAKTLSDKIKQDFLLRFGSPVTGRISAFIPFLPFTPGEQAVVIHKYLLELGFAVEGPVDLSYGPKEKLLGNVRVRIRRDASVCQILARDEYSPELGARSLINAVDSIKSLLVEAYLEVDDEIIESSDISTFIVDVQGGEIAVKMTAPKPVTQPAPS